MKLAIKLFALGTSATLAYAQPIEWKVSDGGNGHWYQTIDTQAQTFDAAQAVAASRGGYLVTITSEEERQFAAAHVGWNGPPGTIGYVGMYQDRGASDYSEPAGGWRWVTGEPVLYWPFGDGSPENSWGIQDWAVTYGDFHFDDWGPGTCCTPIKMTIEWDDACSAGGSSLAITKNPTSRRACGGTSVTFTVSASGPGLSYRWRQNGLELQDGGGTIGAGASTLTIQRVGWNQGGDYDCVVSNDCGSVTSTAATLTACVADIDCDQEVDFGDFLQFFGCLDLQYSCADVDGEPGIDFGDFLAFFNSYDQGC
jgi:hypothetical protein